jgi:lipid A ethanolaminephosphotransferase
MGSHGPAYYKRSAPAQKRFLPECTNTALGQCEKQQLINAYDNTIVATDHFLAETIAWLKTQAGEFAPALLYVSDHGESLGEFGIFLHGLPYAFAPDVQKRVPLIAWLAPAMATRVGLDVDCVRASIAAPLSHDNVFHSVLGLLDVTTPTYRAPLDAFAACRTAKAKAS